MNSFEYTAYGRIGRCFKYSFFAWALMSFVSCVAALCYGSFVLNSKKIFAALFQPNLYVPCAVILILVSIAAIAFTAGAIYATNHELRYLMHSYSVANGVLVLMLIIVAVMGFVFQYQMKEQAVDVQLLATLQTFYGQSSHEDITEAWDFMQQELQCCGVQDDRRQHFPIWRTSKWHMDYKAFPKTNVPLSCCKKISSRDYVDAEECQFSDLQKPNRATLYTEGCFSFLMDDLFRVSTIESILAILISVTLTGSSIFCSLFAKLIRK